MRASVGPTALIPRYTRERSIMANMCVCVRIYVFVCLCTLPASISPELHVQSSPVLGILPTAVARSSSVGVGIRYLLPVL